MAEDKEPVIKQFLARLDALEKKVKDLEETVEEIW